MRRLNTRWLKTHRATILLGVAVLLPVLLTFFFPAAARSLEERLHWKPLLILREKLALEPELDARLRVIVVTDSTLSQLKRHPTFAEIQQIAALLVRNGFERVLVNGFYDLDEIEVAVSREQGAVASNVVTGAAVLPNKIQNARSTAIDQWPGHLAPSCDSLASTFTVGTYAMASTPSILRGTSGIGALNSLDTYRAPLALRSPSGRVVPYLGLFAAPWMPISSGGKAPVCPENLLELSAGLGSIFIDYVSFGGLIRKIIPAAEFFEPQSGRVLEDVSAGLAKKIAGGRVALIIPDGFTGGRSIETPSGLAPSYLAFVSVANSAIGEHYINEVTRVLLAVSISSATAFLVGMTMSLSASLILLLALIASLLVGTVLGFFFGNLLFPTLITASPLILVWGRNAYLHYLNTRREKTALSNELETGRIVQRMFIPQEKEGSNGLWRYKCLYEPYGTLSGDWLQLNFTDRNASLIAIGDVVGKGASASLLTASIAAFWSDLIESPDMGVRDIRTFITRLDSFIKKTFRGEQNTTISLALLCGEKVYLYAAGAPPWHLVKGKKTVDRVITPRAGPLGMSEEIQPNQLTELTVEPGDILFAFTDGVMDGSGARKQYLKRLGSSLTQITDEDLFYVIEGEIRAMPVGAALPDDFTLLMLEFLPESSDRPVALAPDPHPLAQV